MSMNGMEYIDLKAFNGEGLLSEIVSSQENSAYNSFANEEIDIVPTELERSYFEGIKKMLGDEIDDDIATLQSFSSLQSVDYKSEPSMNMFGTTQSVHTINTTKSSYSQNGHQMVSSRTTMNTINVEHDNQMMEEDADDEENGYHGTQSTKEDNPFHVHIFDMSMIDTLHLCPMNLSNNTNEEKIPNSLYSVPNSFEIPNDTTDQKDKIALKWRTQPCAYYQANGFCKKGDKCNFSHEFPHQASKAFVPADQLYRTKPCHFFFTQGVCRKGENCNFSHDPAIFEKAGRMTSAIE